MRIAVVEDEEIIARRLIRLIGRILGDRVGSIRHLSRLDDALEHLTEHPIDLLFLDLDLYGRDGFELLKQAAAGAFQTIVVSARHDEALRAFEFGVVDFVAKPYDEARLRKAIGRVTDADVASRGRLRYLAVKKASAIVPIAIDDVLFIRGADDYSEIHCRDGASHLHGKTLNALDEILPPQFERVHRSYIVDTTKMRSLRSEPGSRYFLTMDGGEEIPVSRTRYRALKRRLG